MDKSDTVRNVHLDRVMQAPADKKSTEDMERAKQAYQETVAVMKGAAAVGAVGGVVAAAVAAAAEAEMKRGAS